MPIDKYFEIIDDCIHYADDGNQQYTVAQIIKNASNTVLSTGLYTEPSKMLHKKLSSDKTWADLDKLFAEEYHNLCGL